MVLVLSNISQNPVTYFVRSSEDFIESKETRNSSVLTPGKDSFIPTKDGTIHIEVYDSGKKVWSGFIPSLSDSKILLEKQQNLWRMKSDEQIFPNLTCSKRISKVLLGCILVGVLMIFGILILLKGS